MQKGHSLSLHDCAIKKVASTSSLRKQPTLSMKKIFSSIHDEYLLIEDGPFLFHNDDIESLH